jgi:iron complex transport system substrate-binding protein
LKTRILFVSTILLAVIIFSAILPGCQPATAPAAPSTPATPSTPAPETRTITDMFGRSVTIPATIKMVLGCTPMDTTMVFMIAPDKIGGLTIPFNSNPLAPGADTSENVARALVNDKYKDIPVIGGWFAMYTTNYETFIAMQPDLVFECQQQFIEERQEKMGSIPVVGIDIWDSTLDDYIPCIDFAADVIGAQDQAEKLVKYFQDARQYAEGIASQIPESERVKVYYAEGKDGLSTDPRNSSHTELVDSFGGINVAEVPLKPGYGMAEVSLETIMTWDPDIIIIGRGAQASLFNYITTDPIWGELRAVKEKRVYIRPENPISWFDGPPCTNQIVGIYWTIQKMYPEQTKGLDIRAKIREFYSEFYEYELSEQEITQLLTYPY